MWLGVQEFLRVCVCCVIDRLSMWAVFCCSVATCRVLVWLPLKPHTHNRCIELAQLSLAHAKLLWSINLVSG